MLASSVRKAVAAAALCAMATASQAAGALDGIYQLGTSEEWLSVHQTGNHVIVGRFFKMGGTHSVLLRNGQTYETNTQGRWYLLAGDLVPGSTQLTFTGESNLGACQSTFRLDFGLSPMWLEWVSETTTPVGAQQGIDCPAHYTAATANGRFYKVTKIY